MTPSLNQGEFLGECLKSVQASSSSSVVEHLIMDGGSTDSTRAVISSLHRGSWVSENDKGQTDAINKGFARSHGQILSYLCADDLLEAGALQAVKAAFARSPSPDVVYGDGWFLEGASGWKRLKKAGPFSYERLRRGNFLIQPSVFFHRRVYEKYGPLNERLQFCMDHEYWLRIGRETSWTYLEIPLATCRLHAGAKTSSQLVKAWDEARAMQAAYGIVFRPSLDALWMRLLGHHYYRLKRSIFESLGKRIRKEP